MSSSEPSYSIGNNSLDLKTTEKIQRTLLDISSLKAFMDQQEAKRQINLHRQKEKGVNSNLKLVGMANKGYTNDSNEAINKNCNLINSLNCQQDEFISAYSKGKNLNNQEETYYYNYNHFLLIKVKFNRLHSDRQ